MLQENPRV